MSGSLFRCTALSTLAIAVTAQAQLFAPLLNGIDNNSVQCILSDASNGGLLLSGGFSYVDGDPISVGIARFTGNAFESLGCGFDWDCITPTPLAGNGWYAFAMAYWNNELFAGGQFRLADWDTVNFIARWDGAAWHSLGAGMDGPVYGLKSYPDGLYVAGWFNHADTVEAHGLARWDGSQWHSVHDLPLWNGAVNGVYDVEVYNGTVYIGGNFSGGWDLNDFAYYDGNQWMSPDSGLFGPFCQVNKLRVHDGLLYVIGSFQKNGPNGVASNPGSGIVTWDGSSFGQLGSGTDGSGNAAVLDCVWRNDTLFALGRFDVIDGLPCGRMAYWDGQHWCCMIPYGYNSGDMVSIGTWADSIYVGGTFTELGSDSISRIAKWIGGGQADTCQAIVGIPELPPTTNQLLLWPNPAQEQLHLSNTAAAYATITDAMGRQVMAVSVPAHGVLSVGALATGYYVLRLRDVAQRMVGLARFAKE